MKPFRMIVHVVFYREPGEDTLYAHALEFNLLGDGPDHHAALANLFDAIATQVHAVAKYGNPADLLTQTDPEVLRKFDAGHDVFEGEMEVEERWLKIEHVVIEDVQAREYHPDAKPEPAAV